MSHLPLVLTDETIQDLTLEDLRLRQCDSVTAMCDVKTQTFLTSHGRGVGMSNPFRGCAKKTQGFQHSP